MGRVDRLDTFGAWLLERLTRNFSARGCDTAVTGLKEDYRALIDEVHGVKREPAPARRSGNSIASAIASVGESVVSVGGSFKAFVNMTARWRTRCCASSRTRAGSASPRWCTSSTMSAGARCRSSC